VVFYPEASALHYGAVSSGSAPTRFYVEMRRADLQYFRKHHGRSGAFGYRLAIWVHELIRLVGYSFLYCSNRRRRSEASLKIRRSISCMRWLLGDTSLLTSREESQTRSRCNWPG
jgi:GT2 family glycosyltransferase